MSYTYTQTNNTYNNIDNIWVGLDITHTWMGDLLIDVIHDGVTARIFNGIGGSSDNLQAWFSPIYSSVLDSSSDWPAATAYNGWDADALTAFYGANPFGDWTIQITDRFGGDIGRLNHVAFQFDVSNVTVPEPSALALMGLGLLGFVATRRKIKK